MGCAFPLLICLVFPSSNEALEDMNIRGEFVGLRINQEDSLLFQLFVDEIALFIQNSQQEFKQAMSAITMFERALGACLNMGKLVIIPMTIRSLKNGVSKWDLGSSNNTRPLSTWGA